MKNIYILSKIFVLVLFSNSTFSQCEQDTIAPVPIVLSGLASVHIDNSEHVTIYAKEFLKSASDNCTDEAYLINSVKIKKSGTNDTLSDFLDIWCVDIQESSVILIDIYVTDEAGNSEFASTYVNVIDDYPCGDEPMFYFTVNTIEGKRLTQNAKIDITYLGDTTYEFSPSIDFTEQPTTFDAILLIHYILNKKFGGNQLEGIELISADCNLDKEIDILDVIEMRKNILGIRKFEKDWRFIRSDLKLQNANNPFLDDFHDEQVFKMNHILPYDSINMEYNFQNALFYLTPLIRFTAFDFITVPVGSFGPIMGGFKNNSDPERNTSTPILIDKNTISKGNTETVTVTLPDSKSLFGLQAQLQFDLDKIDILEVKSNKNCEFFQNNDKISLSWLDLGQTDDNSTLVTLEIRAKEDVTLSEVLKLDERTYQNMAVTSEAVSTNVKLEFSNSVVSHFKDFSPNPFTQSTFLDIESEIEENLSLSIVNHLGQIVFHNEKSIYKGVNKIEISKADLPASGIYFYKIHTKTKDISGKIIAE